MKFLVINQCPTHSNYWSVSIDDDVIGGTRITPTKCCGQWDTIQRWPITDHMKETILEEIGHPVSGRRK